MAEAARKPVPRWYPLVLGILTFLFFLRVLGQVVVAIWKVDFLPPFDEWQSGLLPYPLLLASQIALIALMLKIVRDFARGDGYFVRLRLRTGLVLRWLAGVYFFAMVARYIVTMALYPELRWFTGTIPIWFHFVLAAFLFVLGYYRPAAVLDAATGVPR